jgi:hypothetical protein
LRQNGSARARAFCLTESLIIDFECIDLANFMPTKIDVLRQDELQRIVMRNDAIRAVILPELGGKIGSLVSFETGREFFLQHPDRPYRRARYAAPIGDYDISGFDECLPTISECQYPERPLAGAVMPDHGEVWSRPWKHEIQGEELILEVEGVCLPYFLRRKTRLSGPVMELDYEITNTGNQPFKYLWSAHPLLAIEAGAEIVLPAEVSEVLVDYSAGNCFDIGKTITWPHASEADGKSVTLNPISGPEQKTADKLFTPRLTQGYCGLRFPRTGEAIFFCFDPQLVPFVGLWICQGGFPSDGPPEFTVALEPCNGRPDSLATAIARGECPELAGHATHRWQLQIEIQNGATLS